MNNGSSHPVVNNSLFIGNRGGDHGGGMHNQDTSSPTVINCTFAGNTAVTTGGIWNSSVGTDNSPSLTNCILWGNWDDGEPDESAQMDTVNGTPTIDYSIVQGWTGGLGGIGNSGEDPVFVDADGPDNSYGTVDDDVRLSPGSPAIDAGDSTAVPADSADLDDDGDTSEQTPLDLDGNLRFIDDPDTDDTGVSGSAVVDMGPYEYFPDCNGNGLPDACDVDCSALDGDCNLPGCGESADCDGGVTFPPNDYPDECDIAECTPSHPDFPDCDDCNLNGMPDACDINGGASSDEFPEPDGDGVPDECVDTGSTSGNWTDDIWGLSGGYPDNVDSVPGLHVTLSNVGVFLDESVTIESVRLLDAGSLDVTQDGIEGNLSIVTEAGLFVQGDLDTVGPISPPSSLLVANDRTIDVAVGQMTIGAAGEYKAAASPVSASLTAESILLTEGICECPQAFGALMQLTDAMSVTSLGDFVMRGANVSVCSFCCDESSRGGVIPPPTLLMDCGGARGEATELIIHGDLIISGIVFFSVCAEGGRAPAPSVILKGNLINEATWPAFFDARNARIRFDGTSPQTFEVAGSNMGYTFDGYDNNFAFGKIEVAEGSAVVFKDVVDNDRLSQANAEALYVDTLILRSGSSVTVDHGVVYYRVLVNEGGTIVGDLRAIEYEVVPPGPGLAGPACTPEVKSCHDLGGSGSGNPCSTDDECPSGEFCWDDCWGDWRGARCVVYDHLTGDARCYIPQNRYLTIDPTVNENPAAYSLTLTELDDQYGTLCLPLTGWLGEPVCRDDDTGCPVEPQLPSTDPCQGAGMFGWVSYVVPGPVEARIWNEYPLFVAGQEIAPAATYEIRASVDGITPVEPALNIMTSHDPNGEAQHWGDVTSDPGTTIPWKPPEFATSFSDISAVIKTFEGTGGPALQWSDIEIDHVVSFGDISFLIKAFEGDTYPEITDITGGCPGDPEFPRPLIGHEPCP